jgi:monoamine oxidase
MAGSYRLEGGFGVLTDALIATLPVERLHLSTQITALSQSADGIVATADNDRFTAKRAVLAVPLRLADQIVFSPPLPDTAREFMQSTATWMAGHAKAIAIYDTPFWRDDGLSGDAMSRRGPMVEIHDASPAEGGPYALFGFIGIAAQARRDEPALKQAIAEQFVRLFGSKAANPDALILKDWAWDPLTATAADTQPVNAHPTYGLSPDMNGLMDGRLIFAGTEAAVQSGGYLEGALEAAENAQALIGQAST